MKIFGIAGFSGAGKTTLIEKLIPQFTAAGLKVSLIKHAHHSFDVDQPGKDSHRHRMAGCAEVLVSSNQRWALMHELRGAPEPALEELVKRISPCDLLLVEGFKHESIPKLEVSHGLVYEPMLFSRDSHIVAVASRRPIETPLPQFDINDAVSIAAFIRKHVGLD